MQYSVPAIIAMTASSLYNMVDSIFIGQGVGPLAISGLALTFPLMNLSAAFGAMVGVGAATMISMRLGQRDYDTAKQVLGNVVAKNSSASTLISSSSMFIASSIARAIPEITCSALIAAGAAFTTGSGCDTGVSLLSGTMTDETSAC